MSKFIHITCTYTSSYPPSPLTLKKNATDQGTIMSQKIANKGGGSVDWEVHIRANTHKYIRIAACWKYKTSVPLLLTV